MSNFKNKATRHKKVLRDNIAGIWPGIRRLFKLQKEAYIKSHNVMASKDTLKIIADRLEFTLKSDVDKLVAVLDYKKKKTVTLDIVELALKKRYIDEPDGLVMAKLPFQRYLRELSQSGDGIRFSEEAMYALQSHYESLVNELLTACIQCIIVEKKNIIKEKHINLAFSMKNILCH